MHLRFEHLFLLYYFAFIVLTYHVFNWTLHPAIITSINCHIVWYNNYAKSFIFFWLAISWKWENALKPNWYLYFIFWNKQTLKLLTFMFLVWFCLVAHVGRLIWDRRRRTKLLQKNHKRKVNTCELYNGSSVDSN